MEEVKIDVGEIRPELKGVIKRVQI